MDWAQVVGKPSWTASSEQVHSLYGLSLGLAAFPRLLPSLVGVDRRRAPVCWEAGRLGLKSQLLHFLALWI